MINFNGRINTFLYFILSLMALLLSCSQQYEYAGIKNNNTFTPPETEQIIEFQKAFDKKICKEELQSNIQLTKCYQSFLSGINEKTQKGDLKIDITENEHNEILDKLSPKLRGEFYKNQTVIVQRKIPHSDRAQMYPDTIQTLNVSILGSFFNYIETELVSLDDKVKDYVIACNQIGDLTPAIYGEMIMNYDEMNLQNDQIRLFVTIHFLAMADSNRKSRQSQQELLDKI